MLRSKLDPMLRDSHPDFGRLRDIVAIGVLLLGALPSSY
jgi:hypothetical protein